jgi:hypothetical protein
LLDQQRHDEEKHAMFINSKDPDASLLIRTDFSDDTAWRMLCDLVQQPTPGDGFQAFFVCIDNPNIAATSLAELAKQAAEDLHCSALFIADAEAIGGADHAVLCVDCIDNPGAAFRVIPAEVWGPENNLRLANMDFAEFAAVAGPDGVFRGFPA